jgi:hypothetical protein
MDHLVWWDEEMMVHRTEYTLAARSRYRYVVKQYFYKIKNAYLNIFTCIIEMMYCIHSS